MDLTARASNNIERLLPIPSRNELEYVTDQLILRTNTIRIRLIAKALHASIETKKFGGGLHGLTIPLKNPQGKRAKQGYHYHIVVDPRKVTDNQDVDPWIFVVGHELGHIVSDTFGGIGFGVVQRDQYGLVEAWCSEFGRVLGRKVSDSRR